MSLIATVLAYTKEHPFTSGIMSSASTGGFSIMGLLTNETTVRFIACCGGLLGIILTLMSIYQKWLQIKKGE